MENDAHDTGGLGMLEKTHTTSDPLRRTPRAGTTPARFFTRVSTPCCLPENVGDEPNRPARLRRDGRAHNHAQRCYLYLGRDAVLSPNSAGYDTE